MSMKIYRLEVSSFMQQDLRLVYKVIGFSSQYLLQLLILFLTIFYFIIIILLIIHYQYQMIIVLCVVSFLFAYVALAMLGYYLINKILKKYNNVPEMQVNQQLKGFHRDDFNKWDRKQIIYGSIVRFPRNIMLLLYGLFSFSLSIPFIVLLQKLSGRLHLGLRIYKKIFQLFGIIFPLFSSMRIVQDESVKDYNTPIIISNHVNWFDIVYLIYRKNPVSFTSKAAVAKVPFVSYIAKFLQTIFIDRSQQAKRSLIKDQIKQRIENFRTKESSYDVFPLVIFPQGTTSNGRSLLKFKAGAFDDLADITMVLFHYSCKNFGMGMQLIKQYEHLCISMCLKTEVVIKMKKMTALQGQTGIQYMARCKEQMSKSLGYKCYQAGFREKQNHQLNFEEALKQSKNIKQQ